MKIERISAGWRLGAVIGGKMCRIWLVRWIITLYDGIGPMRAN